MEQLNAEKRVMSTNGGSRNKQEKNWLGMSLAI